jgi:alpha-L-rhamnosidase
MSLPERLFPPEAFWIGSDHPFDLHEAYLCFRSPNDWQLDRLPETAELDITADSRYKLWVNGRFVARGPGRSYPQMQSVDRLDLAPYLRAGANTIAVQVYQPGYSHFSYVHRGAAGMLAHLVCDGETSLVSDPRWTTRRDASFAALAPRVSIYGSGVEERDLNAADNWIDLDYDDSGWPAARVVALAGGYPWTTLRRRSLPLLVERAVPLKLLEIRRGGSADYRHGDSHTTLREGWYSARPQPGQADEAGWYTIALGSGESAYWLFDLGRDYTCQGWAEIEGAAGQELLAISYAEKIRDGELVISDPQTYCRVRLTDCFNLRPGSQEAETFALRGGRYLLFQLTGPTGPNCRLRPHARVSEYPLLVSTKLPEIGPPLDQIMTLCENTLRACLQDGFVDCAWRESTQWLGDALPQSLIMAAMSDDTRPMRQVLEMAAQGAYPDGVLPSVLPGEVQAYAVVDYNFMWVELLRFYQRRTADNDFAAGLWPVLERMLNRFHQDLNEAGLLISQAGRRLFLDWAPGSRSEPNAIYNLHYLLALQQAAATARDLGLTSRAANDFASRAAALQAACRHAFRHNDCWYDDLQQSTASQLAAAFALLTGTAQVGEREALLDAVAARSLDPNDDPAPGKLVLASPFMHHYVFEALRQGGRSEQVVEIIRRRWGRWVEAGYPTTWENWDVDFPDGSQCHAFSAHPRYHLAAILEEQSVL